MGPFIIFMYKVYNKLDVLKYTRGSLRATLRLAQTSNSMLELHTPHLDIRLLASVSSLLLPEPRGEDGLK